MNERREGEGAWKMKGKMVSRFEMTLFHISGSQTLLKFRWEVYDRIRSIDV